MYHGLLTLGRAWPRGFSCQGTVEGWNCSFPHEPLSNGFSPMCPCNEKSTNQYRHDLKHSSQSYLSLFRSFTLTNRQNRTKSQRHGCFRSMERFVNAKKGRTRLPLRQFREKIFIPRAVFPSFFASRASESLSRRKERHRSPRVRSFQSFLFFLFPLDVRSRSGELIFVIYSAPYSSPLSRLCTPRKPYFSFNFISNLESCHCERWHAHKSAGIMRTLRLRPARPLARRRIPYGPAIISFFTSLVDFCPPRLY